MGQGPPMVVSRTFQSLEDFIREQDQLDAVRSAEMRARAATALAYSNPNSKKFKKAPPAIDVEVVAAEARAVAEIAATNWTGRLGGVPLLLLLLCGINTDSSNRVSRRTPHGSICQRLGI